MNIKHLTIIFKKQLGFTLIELLVAVAISGLLLTAAGMGLIQVMSRFNPTDNDLQAIHNVQAAGESISRDAANAENAVFDSNNCPTFSWHDFGYTDDAHKTTITYYLSADGSLMRSFQYGTSAGVRPDDNLVASHIIVLKQTSRKSNMPSHQVRWLSLNYANFTIFNRFMGSPQIWTDKDDYAPGETVKVWGKGFWPEEPVHLEAVGAPNGLTFAGDGTTDNSGCFSAVMQLPDEWDEKYILTATGSRSGFIATFTFADHHINGVAVGSQSGTLNRGTGGTVTFPITLTNTGNSGGNITLSIPSWSPGQPTGVTFLFTGGGVLSEDTTSAVLTMFSTASSPAGSYIFTVKAQDSKGSYTNQGTLLINNASTATSISSSSNPSSPGQSVAFTATVTGSGATPTGTVTFKDGGNTLGTGTLNGSGVTTYATSGLTTGSHSITAVYGGDTNYNSSTSTTLTQNVLKASTVAVVSSVNPSNPGQSVTFTATVTGTGGTPTGTVTFMDGGNTLGTGTLNGSGVATYTTSSLTTGSHTITASYSGDSNFGGSSGTLSGGQTVSASTPTPTGTPSTSGSRFIAANISLGTPQVNGALITITINSTLGGVTESKTYNLTMRNYTAP